MSAVRLLENREQRYIKTMNNYSSTYFTQEILLSLSAKNCQFKEISCHHLPFRHTLRPICVLILTLVVGLYTKFTAQIWRSNRKQDTVTALTHICPDILLPPKQKAFQLLQTVVSSKSNREKYSTTPSLNKGSPSSEVH